jgi:hypothetical protein
MSAVISRKDANGLFIVLANATAALAGRKVIGLFRIFRRGKPRLNSRVHITAQIVSRKRAPISIKTTTIRIAFMARALAGVQAEGHR